MVGRMFGVAGLTMIVVQGGIIGRLVKRFGEAALVPAGIGLLSLSLFILPFAEPAAQMTAVFMLMAVGQGIASPSLHSLISRGTSPDEQGFVLGTNQSMSALARAVGPSIAGFVDLGAPAWPFSASATILALALPLSMKAVRTNVQP